jgi:hypothetical protein
MHSISKTVFDKLCENAQIKEQVPALAKALLFPCARGEDRIEPAP